MTNITDKKINNNKKPSSFGGRIKSLTDRKWFSAFMASLLAIILGLFFGFMVMLFADPPKAVLGIITVLTAGFSNIGTVMYFATPILMTGLSVGFAFKMGLFNIGASGQYTMGMFFAIYAALMIKGLPAGVHTTVCVFAGLLGGIIWGAIPGIFKAYLNVNEVITSIMFNYIGMYVVDMLIVNSSVLFHTKKTRTNPLPQSALLPSLGFKNSNVSIAIILAILIALALYFLLNRTVFGYELKITGFNRHASEYAGMKGKRNTVATMLISGGLAGLGGAFAILAPSAISGSSVTYEPINIIAANGFTGIAVALLGNSNPIAIIFSATFISFIQRGGTAATSYKPEIIDIVISIIIYFSAFALLMKTSFGGFIMSIKARFFRKKIKIKAPQNLGNPGTDIDTNTDDSEQA